MSPKKETPNETEEMAAPLSLNDLRAILSDEITKIRNGRSTPATVNAVSNATGKILSSVKLEIEYHKLIGKTPTIPMLAGEGEAE